MIRWTRDYMLKSLLTMSYSELDEDAAQLQARADEVGTSNEFDYNYLLFLKATVLRAKEIKQRRDAQQQE